MTAHLSKPRVFLFLQGPHGPFFHRLGVMLRRAGATVWRVGFNAGDQAFWFDKQSYIPFRAPPSDWPATFVELVEQKSVTDLVLYGDVRPIHAKAVAAAKRRGITIHVFEEGYMRPYWVTYERGGTNGNSRLMDTSIFEMRTALAQSNIETSSSTRALGRHAPTYLLWRAVSLVCHVSETAAMKISNHTVT